MLSTSYERRRATPHRTILELRDLADIREPEVNLILWPRPTDPWMSALSRVTDHDVSASLCMDSATLALDGLVAPFEALLDPQTWRLLRQDVGVLLGALFRATRPAHVDVSLAVVRDDACRKFHVDRREARLICTYAGPGTQWVPDHAVDRSALGREGLDFVAGNAAIVKDPREIRAIPSPWVALLKGTAWPGNDDHGLVHRSPPIAEAGLRRLVLMADAYAR